MSTMDDEEENLTTFLAYTKSPKTTKRTSFQDELKKAVSARVSRQQAVEETGYSDYSDEFDSDAQGFGISLSDESLKSTPLHSNLSGRSSHLEDKAEGKYSGDKQTSLSAPSSLMRLNDKVSTSKTQSFSERSSPEGHRLSSPPSPKSRFMPLSITSDKNNRTISVGKTADIAKDLQVGEEDDNGNKETSGNGRRSPSVFDMMMSDVKEKTLQETKDVFVSKSHRNQSVEQIDEDIEKIKQKIGQLEHQKNLKAALDVGGSHSNRSFSAPVTKKSPKSAPQVSAKSRYLGTLTVLDTSVNKNGGDIEAADKLRATVYQNWVEKKKIFLHELKKIKQAEEQLEKEKARQESTMKKEEAMAAFMAWKAEKKKVINQGQKMQKMEEKKKMEELKELAARKEDCRRVRCVARVEHYSHPPALQLLLDSRRGGRKESRVRMDET
ncbi:hypothetical protein GDO81_000518 [Engystomops pustulosus]|uniref:Microtubule-associated protein 9 n=1 Tax=Engystomops pustulosus TaxID=76066 RepID=A0AAV7D722_ENGPU|nr:hypothetical protein GDO81_000518 [Engystomops pustulosus]